MSLSVVIPCRNTAATLPAQLEALARQTAPPLEVIVADNGSTDATRATAESFRDRLPRLQVVDASDRPGAAYARNVGAAIATGQYVVFCDADDVVDANWLAGLQRALREHDFVASRFEVRQLAGPNDRFQHAQETGLQNVYGFLPHAGGCGLAIRRDVHLAVGGFDPSVRYLEDTDYCWRVQLAGTPLGFAPDAVVHVRLGRPPGSTFIRSYRWAMREVQLYRRYRDKGFPPPDNRSAMRAWLRIPREALGIIRGRRSVTGFAWHLGTRVGRLTGMLVYLTPMW